MLLQIAQIKEDECQRLSRERDDLNDQLSIEKRRFTELTDKLLSQQSGATHQDDQQMSVGATQRMWELEDKLRSKESELHVRLLFVLLLLVYV